MEQEFCGKCEKYNKHVAQPNNLPLRNTFPVGGSICRVCYPSRPINKKEFNAVVDELRKKYSNLSGTGEN